MHVVPLGGVSLTPAASPSTFPITESGQQVRRHSNTVACTTTDTVYNRCAEERLRHQVYMEDAVSGQYRQKPPVVEDSVSVVSPKETPKETIMEKAFEFVVETLKGIDRATRFPTAHGFSLTGMFQDVMSQFKAREKACEQDVCVVSHPPSIAQVDKWNLFETSLRYAKNWDDADVILFGSSHGPVSEISVRRMGQALSEDGIPTTMLLEGYPYKKSTGGSFKITGWESEKYQTKNRERYVEYFEIRPKMFKTPEEFIAMNKAGFERVFHETVAVRNKKLAQHIQLERSQGRRVIVQAGCSHIVGPKTDELHNSLIQTKTSYAVVIEKDCTKEAMSPFKDEIETEMYVAWFRQRYMHLHEQLRVYEEWNKMDGSEGSAGKKAQLEVLTKETFTYLNRMRPYKQYKISDQCNISILMGELYSKMPDSPDRDRVLKQWTRLIDRLTGEFPDLPDVLEAKCRFLIKDLDVRGKVDVQTKKILSELMAIDRKLDAFYDHLNMDIGDASGCKSYIKSIQDRLRVQGVTSHDEL